MKITLALLIIFSSCTAFAKAKGHKHHHAHVHGAATLSLAFDGLNGRIEFKAAAEAVVGFEHEAKSEKDKAQLAARIAEFESTLSLMIKFDPSLECVFTKDKIGLVAETATGKKSKAVHADFLAFVNVACKKSPSGTKMIFDFTSFKSLKNIDTTILIGDLQKSVEIKAQPLTLELK